MHSHPQKMLGSRFFPYRIGNSPVGAAHCGGIPCIAPQAAEAAYAPAGCGIRPNCVSSET